MIGAALFSLSMLLQSVWPGVKRPPEKSRYLVRVESEYSLGLSRSSSLANDLAELGPLCQSGQLLMTAVKVSAVSAAVLAVLWQNRSKR